MFLVFLVIVGSFPGTVVLAAHSGASPSSWRLALGLGVLLGTLNVFYRDVEQTVGMVLQLLVLAHADRLSGARAAGLFAAVLAWNPMWPPVHFAQTIFLDDRAPDWTSLLYPAVLAGGLLLVALRAFRALSARHRGRAVMGHLRVRDLGKAYKRYARKSRPAARVARHGRAARAHVGAARRDFRRSRR